MVFFYLYYTLPLIISLFCLLQVEVKRTKNTERRVQRQVVLEDGRVLNVGGPPHVVVDTIEDIETHETNHVEDQAILDEIKGTKIILTHQCPYWQCVIYSCMLYQVYTYVSGLFLIHRCYGQVIWRNFQT